MSFGELPKGNSVLKRGEEVCHGVEISLFASGGDDGIGDGWTGCLTNKNGRSDK